MKIKVGDTAPDFKLPSNAGAEISLSDFKGKKSVVLYFYPKDETPGCTREARAFMKSYEAFRQKGAEVVGVSSDTVDSHKKFADHCSISFPLLSDQQGRLRRAYQVPSTLGILPGRVTYIIDREGIVKHIFNSQTHPEQHVEQALKSLQE